MPYGRGNDRVVKPRVCSMCQGPLDGSHNSYCKKCYSDYQSMYKALHGMRHRLNVIKDDNTNWRDQAACKKRTDMMYPFNDDAQRSVAEYMCKRTCPVIDQCLRFALDNRQDYGVWGGTTENERRVLLNRTQRRLGAIPDRLSESSSSLSFTQ